MWLLLLALEWTNPRSGIAELKHINSHAQVAMIIKAGRRALSIVIAACGFKTLQPLLVPVIVPVFERGKNSSSSSTRKVL